MKGLNFVEDLKIRGGYGIMGNSNNVDPNNQFSLFQTITPSDGSKNIYTGAITDDHQWMFFGSGSGTVSVYTFNETTFEF